MRKYILLLIALCLHVAARGQTEYEFEYWFDNDRSTLQKGHSSMASWQIEADISSLDEKLHAIHVHVCDSDSIFSVPVTRHFIKASNLSEMKIRCWFDGDFSTMQEGENTGNVILFDVANLADGYHTLQIQADGGSGAISAPITKGFVKIPQTIGVEDFTCLCMIDNKVFKQEKVPVGQGIVTWDIDVSSLSQGFHRILIQIVTPSGAASNVWQSFFLRDATLEEYGELKCVYAIDGAEFYSEAGTMTNGIFHFDLDVSSLENGLHQITYMLNNGKGVTTQTRTQFFIKTPLGGNGISEYWYWLNEQDEEQIQKISLPEQKETFQLISLLPVESQPIRSKLFQFRVEDGKPVMYAKNDIHLRFFDAAGRFTNISKQYVDENVKQEVTDVTPILSNIRKTIPCPSGNKVHWFSLEAQRGDSLIFKSDKACTLQLFSPSGMELYKVSGVESVVFDGSYAPEDGIYYLALHDLTATQGNEVSIEYQRIDKYAVLSYTPHEIGIAVSYIEMELHGNGYDKLENASLCMKNDTILADSIIINTKYSTRLGFKIIGEENSGVYDLCLAFCDGTENDTLIVHEAVTFSTADYSGIDVHVKTSPTLASPYPVTVSITNKGNVGLLYIPFNIAFTTGQVESIHFKNFYNYFKYASNDVPLDSIEYCPYVTTDNLFGTGKNGFVWYFLIPQLLPHETKTLILGFKAPNHAKYDFYAWVGTPLNIETMEKDSITNIPSVWNYLYGISTYNMSQRNQVRRKLSVQDIFETARELGNAGRAGMSTGRTAGATGAALGGIYNGISLWQMNQWVDPDDPVAQGALSDYRNARRNGMLSPEAIGNLAGRGWGIAAGYLSGNHENSANNGPEPEQNPIEQWNPGDPNDIFGYLSQAGSKFIADSVARVYYTIEFENDTTFATAAAHTIVIKDTLDSQYFDLKKFMPTGVRIGEHETFLNEADVVTKNNVTSFVKTIDMRPAINAIAQVDGTFNHTTGIAEWRFTSLDPMTMEPTDDLMQGILPVNYNGTSGIGEVMFEVGVKQGKADGTELKNRAGIVFDYEAPILTPTWTNIVDAVAPSSVINNSWMANDSTLRVTADAFDARSGVWKYEWYVQAGENAPWWKEGETYSNSFDYHIYEGIDYGFCVLVTDSAGNVEQKVIERERGFKTYGPDYEDTIEEVPATAVETEDAYDVSGRKVGQKAKGVIIRNRKKTLVTE